MGAAKSVLGTVGRMVGPSVIKTIGSMTPHIVKTIGSLGSEVVNTIGNKAIGIAQNIIGDDGGNQGQETMQEIAKMPPPGRLPYKIQKEDYYSRVPEYRERARQPAMEEDYEPVRQPVQKRRRAQEYNDDGEAKYQKKRIVDDDVYMEGKTYQENPGRAIVAAEGPRNIIRRRRSFEL